MARRRTQTTETPTNTGEKMSDLMFEALSDEEIGEALSSQRSKGEYKSILQQIVDNGVRAARIPTDRGPFEGRKASTVKTGFENARKADDAPEEFKQLKVSSKKGNVYIVNTAVASS
jgi:hypothetical protein